MIEKIPSIDRENLEENEERALEELESLIVSSLYLARSSRLFIDAFLANLLIDLSKNKHYSLVKTFSIINTNMNSLRENISVLNNRNWDRRLEKHIPELNQAIDKIINRIRLKISVIARTNSGDSGSIDIFKEYLSSESARREISQKYSHNFQSMYITETVKAYNQVSAEGHKSLTWTSRLCSTTCPQCRSRHGKKIKSGDVLPPLHPNCYCIVYAET
jgi:hypothetical protein